MEASAGRDPEQLIERDIDDLERDLEKVSDHLDDARKAAQARADEALTEGSEVRQVAGEWEGEARTDQDPSGLDMDDKPDAGE
jgi:hypothetical protein